MSNIEKLLEGVEVEWKTLGEIGRFYGGITGKSKDDFTDGNAKFVTYKNVYANPALKLNVKEKVKIGDKEKQYTLQYSDIIFTGSSETPDECGLSSVVTEKTDEKLYLNSFCFFLRLKDTNTIFPDFAKHLFRSNNLRKQISKTASGVTRFNVSKKLMEKVSIPIPPLEIQKEIVRILDKFSTLTAELQAELQARKSQYEYYRNQLLTYPMEESDQPSLRPSRSATSIQSSDNPTQPLSTSNPHTSNSVLQPRGKVEWKTLEEIFNLKNGYTPSKSNQEYWENGTIPWFRMEDIRENGRVLNKSIQYVNSCAIKGGKLFPANSIIVATSATIGEHALITVPFLSNQRFTNLSLKREYDDKFIIKFLFYYGFVLDEWCKNNITIGNFAGVDMIEFKKFLIPIPPLEEQERIVSILDKFETLTTSITEGLPKEIELRQKQYEYYRDRLLSFPKNNIKV